MKTLGKLEQLLLAGEITEEEYKERKEVYVETHNVQYNIAIR